MIGDYLGTIEEYVPGEGTYAEDGKIYAAGIGKAVFDKENQTVSVSAKSTVVEPAVGQIVFGEVTGFRKNTVSVSVSKILGKKAEVKFKADIYVSNISDKYVDKPESLFGIGDVVKAKILKIDPTGMIDLSTKEEFGVVKAYCKVCRKPLTTPGKEDGLFECDSCGNNEKRKTAKDFGNVVL